VQYGADAGINPVLWLFIHVQSDDSAAFFLAASHLVLKTENASVIAIRVATGTANGSVIVIVTVIVIAIVIVIVTVTVTVTVTGSTIAASGIPAAAAGTMWTVAT
jgi:hypothetical protein